MVSKSIVRLTGGAVPARTENELGLAGTEAAEWGEPDHMQFRRARSGFGLCLESNEKPLGLNMGRK